MSEKRKLTIELSDSEISQILKTKNIDYDRENRSLRDMFSEFFKKLILDTNLPHVSNQPTEEPTRQEPTCDLFSPHPHDPAYCYCKGKKIPLAWCLKQFARSQQRGWRRCYPPYEPFKPRPRQTQPKTKPYRDNFERAYYPTQGMGSIPDSAFQGENW